MLKTHPMHATLHATDLTRAKRFYAEILGLEPLQELPFALIYECGERTLFTLSESSGVVPGTFTQMSFIVDDIAREVDDLITKGVKFEEYDTEDLRTVSGVADTGALKGAWFKDSEGNLIGLVELSAEYRLPR
ncbi:VOC family protein [Georgenia sp. SYP-B2076]|uniref:VOC family protein n=1 Tax=Georgenia sp. SYP-B2076 TaxID=2495881 RepID=UPI00197A9A56|nr:VOC family protein [Georgenia sp. SYP-B2076]